MEPKISFGGVAYCWIENFLKVYMLFRVEKKSTTDTRAGLQKLKKIHLPLHFFFVPRDPNK